MNLSQLIRLVFLVDQEVAVVLRKLVQPMRVDPVQQDKETPVVMVLEKMDILLVEVAVPVQLEEMQLRIQNRVTAGQESILQLLEHP
jgi:predicted nucleic acid-binding OB-fold protein